MRQAVRAIVVKDDKLLVMHRNKFGQEYYTLPGGGIDPGETGEQSLTRELAEETSVTVQNPRLVFVEEAGDPFGTQYIYLCEYTGGEPELSQLSEEYKISALGQNLYEPKWVEIAKLDELPFLSEHLKDAIVNCLEDGFPEKPVDITHGLQVQ